MLTVFTILILFALLVMFVDALHRRGTYSILYSLPYSLLPTPCLSPHSRSATFFYLLAATTSGHSHH